MYVQYHIHFSRSSALLKFQVVLACHLLQQLLRMTIRIQFFQIPDSITVEDSSNSDALQFTSTPTRYVTIFTICRHYQSQKQLLTKHHQHHHDRM